jgi:hypothetical protein
MTDYLTITGKVDGFGAQLLSKITGIVYCLRLGITYIHTPFEVMTINESDDIDDLEYFCGMSSGEILIQDFSLGPEKLESKKIIMDVVTSQDPDSYYTETARALLRKKYYSTPKSELKFFSSKHLNACLHVRRDDVGPSSPERYTEDAVYLQTIDSLNELHSNIHFHIFSDGSRADLAQFERYNNASLYPQYALKESFHAMVEADILVPAKSAFSYCAALLNEDGTIINNCMTPFYSKDQTQMCYPLASWTSL